jgi:hypothetical protein
MSFARALLIWRITVLALAALFALAGIVGVLADWNARETAFWLVFLLGGALLLLLGNTLFDRSPPLAGILASLGAAAGGIALFWLILVPLAAAVVVALSVALARQAPAAT